MKNLISFLIVLFCVTSSFAQEPNGIQKKIIKNEAKVISLSYKVNTVKELKTLDWKSIKEIFETNNEDEIIKMSFELDLKESKNNFKSSLTVGGETKNIDSLITKAKKGIKSLIKISKNYENK